MGQRPTTRAAPRPRPAARLPREVVDEIQQVAHRGKAGVVGGLVAGALRAFEQERFAQALAGLARAKPLAPRSPTVRLLLGLTHYRLGRWRDAARELAAYRRLSGRRDHDHILADCERALGRPERALELLEGIEPGEVGEEVWVEGLIVGAGALCDLGRPEEAVQRLRRGPVEPRTVREHHLRLWYALADALERAGRRREARPWWDLVYAEDPEFFDVADRRLGRRGPH